MDNFEPRRCKDIKVIVAPEEGPKIFVTFEKQAPDQSTTEKAEFD